ncbi:MAG: lipoyl synthase [Candidatus Moranbacteria bacterium]|nr:lipoyl synthase [Candidatus Moranbacteria bacterium]
MNNFSKNSAYQDKLPSWFKMKNFTRSEYLKTLKLIKKHNLNTVCLSANCPNRYECFSKGTATFLILGNVCTRNCRYCNIKKGKPKDADPAEPKRIAEAVEKLNLHYAVITCVTRDDLPDGGAGQFVSVAEEIRKRKPDCKIEFLISDFGGSAKALRSIVSAKPEVINHNIEVSKELFLKLRPQGSYALSLDLLRKIKEIDPGLKTKSGFMLGLGENHDQIIQTMKDLAEAGCDIITIGQYLQPSPENAPVKKYYKPEEFEKIRESGLRLGLKKIVAGPLARSSYHAEEVAKKTG